MLEKQTEKKLQDALRHIDPEKLAQAKELLASEGGLRSLAKRLDVQKAQRKLNELHIGELLSESELSGALEALGKNPELLNEIKKNL